MNILVIDAQGGGIGKQLVTSIKQHVPEAHVIAVGTNNTATAAMLKAGADEAATGENSVVVGCRKADIIVGPIGIIIADAMLGEVTPKMALAVAQSDAKRILIPFQHCDNIIVGISDFSTGTLIQSAIEEILNTPSANPKPSAV
ncbi:MAG: DUF3842 family protein [Lachnospiraceae bacterium]|nr:DUF3842 family protein [Lachnospiraceae bacterium]